MSSSSLSILHIGCACSLRAVQSISYALGAVMAGYSSTGWELNSTFFKTLKYILIKLIIKYSPKKQDQCRLWSFIKVLLKETKNFKRLWSMVDKQSLENV